MNLRQAFRGWMRSPGLGVLLVLTLALGLGGAVTGIAVADRALVNPLGLPHPERVLGIAASGAPASVAIYARLPAFAAVAGYSTGRVPVAAGASQNACNVSGVTEGFFQVAGVTPQRGRVFTDAELQAGDRVAVVSADLSGSGFGGAGALGRSIRIGTTAFTVVGVMPARFGFPYATDVWIPSRSAGLSLRLLAAPPAGALRQNRLIGRLRPGTSEQDAAIEVRQQMQREAEAYNDAHPTGGRMGVSTVFVASLAASRSGSFRPTVDLLLAAALLLWLVACASLGGVLLARTLASRQDALTRLTLGASRSSLLRARLADAFILTTPSVVAAAGAMTVLMACLRRWAPPQFPGLDLLHPAAADFALLAAMAVPSLLLTTLPAGLYTLRLRLRTGQDFAPRPGWTWPALVTFELAGALSLTVAAGLLLSSYTRLMRVDLGFSARGVTTVQFTALPAMQSAQKQIATAPPGRRRAIAVALASHTAELSLQVLQAAARTPGIEAALASNPPLLGETSGQYVYAPGQVSAGTISVTENISRGYFHLMTIPLLRGRDFAAGDTTTTAPVIIVSRSLAERLWPHLNPVGRRLITGNEAPLARVVVGEVADIHSTAPGEPNWGTGQAYFPWRQPYNDGLPMVMTLLARTPGTGGAALAALPGSVSGIEPLDTTSLDAATSRAISGQRFNTLLLAAFSAMVLLLAWLGLLGMLAFSVIALRHEYAVRLALGASPARVLRLVFGRAARLALAATALALAAAGAEGSLMRHLLFGVGALDPGVWAGAVVLIMLLALAAAVLPGWRAAHMQPLQFLRYE